MQITTGGAAWWPAYLVPCWFAAVVVTVRWIRRQGFAARPPLLQSNHTHRVDIAARLGRRPVEGLLWRALARLPGNQNFVVQFHDKALALPRLDPALDGLSILHLSDFHFTGRIGKEFFREVTRLAMQAPPDLIALTGDFVDNADCIAWIPEALGQLAAKHGVYFVLGNHDPRMGEVPRLRQALAAAGFIDLAGRWLRWKSTAARSCSPAMKCLGSHPSRT